MIHGFSIDPRFTLAGFLVGLLVGQTGVGGGSLMTPLLVLVFGMHPASAVGTDLLYASATKSVGTLIHGANRTVDWVITRRLAAGSVPAAILTLLAMSRFNLNSPGSARVISVALGVTLVLTALSLVFRQKFLAAVGPKLERITGRQTVGLTVATGAVLGFLVTISSVGAGALGVTALLLLYPRAPMPVIVGSDIAHAGPLTLLAGLGHWWLGSVDAPLLLSLLSGSIPGIILGSELAVRAPEALSRLVLAATLTVVGLKMVL